MTSQVARAAGRDGKPERDAWGQPVERAPTVDHLTLRQSVNVSAGGGRVRIRLSNYYGRASLTVSTARIALGAGHAGDLSAIDPGSDRPLSFDGKPSVTIAPGSEAVSDPVDLHVPALSNVVVSLYFDGPAQLADFHPLERAHTTYAVDGDATRQPSLAQRPAAKALPRTRDDHIYLLAGVEVEAPADIRGIVAFGDSITDGYLASAPGASWPAVLARVAQRNGDAAAVVNAGISADELTTDQIGAPGAGASGLKRFLRDVVDRPGVTDVVVLFGANDINRGIDPAGYPNGASTGDLIASMRMLADVAHQHHLRIYAGTVTPFAGVSDWYSPQREAVRLQFNEWIRHSGAFDGVIDFAEAVAGAYAPPPLVAKQSPLPVGMATVCAGDAGLHPNDRGYAVMGTLAYDVLFHAKLSPPQGCH
ncbi:GDSL-type esterase/lipase family protein [Rhodanobacter sp. Si-c]|uniref:GDSL-type esterase/lipase family protein n=1 Tax=Rhodanobacter lycopersici TaxID=3162487 RepID=A0ABV3QFT3_9GAMM